ncbi:MAG: 13E12 repeat family protein, partial [Sporichthyaceae bacterium]|nr:13E12 repeat family protein [Sporichthyaceae bacterium]
MDWGSDPAGVRVVEPPDDAALVAVRAAVAGLVAADPKSLTSASRRVRIVELERLSAVLAAHQLACLEVFDAGGEARADGAASTQAWLCANTRVSPAQASAQVRLARRLDRYRLVAAALAAGELGVRHAEVVTRCLDEVAAGLGDGVRAAEVERGLVAVARLADPLRLSRECARLRHQVAPEMATAADWNAHAARELSLSVTVAGMVAVSGTLDPLTGEAVLAAVGSLAAPSGPDDARSPGQRRADALGELARRQLAAGGLPAAAGEPAQVLVTVDLTTLEGRAGMDPALFSWVGPVSGELARRVACDAKVTRVITDGASQPLDLGRATRIVGSGLRKALWVRDRHCRYPGCTVRAQW